MFFLFLLKIWSIGPVDQQANLVTPNGLLFPSGHTKQNELPEDQLSGRSMNVFWMSIDVYKSVSTESVFCVVHKATD